MRIRKLVILYMPIFLNTVISYPKLHDYCDIIKTEMHMDRGEQIESHKNIIFPQKSWLYYSKINNLITISN